MPQSDQKGFEYIELSARQGYAEGEFNLGFMFCYGCGVEKDWNKARELWTRAAEHGHEFASKRLQKLDDEEEEEEERKRNETTNKREPIDEEEKEDEEEIEE